MSSEKTTAIILKVVDYSETSCVITLFTRTSGKISGLAKGARRPKGPFHGAIDVLSISQVLFLPRKSASLDLLTEARLVRRFRPCQWSLTRLYAGYYIAELLLETLEPHASMPELFAQTVRSLSDLQVTEDQWGYLPASTIVMHFELQLLGHLGQQLELEHCGGCGKPIDETTSEASRRFFSVIDSSLICPACASGRRQLIELNVEQWQLLKELQNPETDGWKARSTEALSTRLRDLLDQHWRALLNRKLKLQPAIRQMLSREKQQTHRFDRRSSAAD